MGVLNLSFKCIACLATDDYSEPIRNENTAAPLWFFRQQSDNYGALTFRATNNKQSLPLTQMGHRLDIFFKTQYIFSKDKH